MSVNMRFNSVDFILVLLYEQLLAFSNSSLFCTLAVRIRLGWQRARSFFRLKEIVYRGSPLRPENKLSDVIIVKPRRHSLTYSQVTFSVTFRANLSFSALCN